MLLNKEVITHVVKSALAEDGILGKAAGEDVTAALIDPQLTANAVIISRSDAVICGTQLVDAVFAQLDPNVKIEWLVKDGAVLDKPSTLCRLHGPVRALLTGERTALNFLQMLSGISYLTHCYCQQLKGSKTCLLDTRKTLPTLRLLQKYAVYCGGGKNHRMSLDEMILIKENHLALFGSIPAITRLARQRYPHLKIEIEVANFDQFKTALDCDVDIIMLDNFSPDDIRMALEFKQQKKSSILIEVSGGINITNIGEYANLGADYISVGEITKSVSALDLSMLII